MIVGLIVSFLVVAGDDPDDADFDPEYGAMTSPKRNKVITYVFLYLRPLYY